MLRARVALIITGEDPWQKPMTPKEKQAWATVAVMFLTLCFIGGIINANGVFILPLIKQFGWSRRRSRC